MRYENVGKRFLQKRLDRKYTLEACIDIDKDMHELEIVCSLDVLAVNKDTMKCTSIADMNGMDDLRPAKSNHMSEKELFEYFLMAFAMIDEQKALKLLYEDESEGAWERAYYGDIPSEPVMRIDSVVDDGAEYLALLVYPSAVSKTAAVVTTSASEMCDLSIPEYNDEVERMNNVSKDWRCPVQLLIQPLDLFTEEELGDENEGDDEEEFLEYSFTAYGPAGAGEERFDGYTSYEDAQKGQARLMSVGYTGFSAICGVEEEKEPDEMDGFTIGDQMEADQGDYDD